ncbi:type I-E CRISPR-associated protein Cas7/Cse4/CasC [Granulibacter bethesdensis]|uniref:type I-E CRISPR-associated protein Cas7/Cse4/CasC n=1 Tax=Granulibacter bethesdensis TaxID=364410 RepID=UPI00046D27A8|nr:type I-E CRISPR-associated protein Cas7/Cse4/CasC [Granulibacter bethesdensis]
MPKLRFLQIHTLHSYTASLLNRDDRGLPKYLPYGSAVRTRISSQCLKRHWRMDEGTFSLHQIEGAEEAVRSRDLVTKRLREPLQGTVDVNILDAIEPAFQAAVYGKKGADDKSSRQPLLFGAPELRYLAEQFTRIATSATDPKSAKAAAEDFTKDKLFQNTMKAMRDSVSLPGGLTSALFGRMVTSDPEANIDAPVHVAHAFTTHAEQTESDYFAVVDDLAGVEDTGADHIGETELTSGLFYGYVVIDVPALVSNLTGVAASNWLAADRKMAAEVAACLIGQIATVSPGAKLGSTAPYGYATTMLVEAGDRQPRSLAEAFRDPAEPTVQDAEDKLHQKLKAFDEAYQTGEDRRLLSLSNDPGIKNVSRTSLPELMQWVRDTILKAA